MKSVTILMSCLGCHSHVWRWWCMVGCSKDHSRDYSDPTPPAYQARPSSQQGHKKSIKNSRKKSNIEFRILKIFRRSFLSLPSKSNDYPLIYNMNYLIDHSEDSRTFSLSISQYGYQNSNI